MARGAESSLRSFYVANARLGFSEVLRVLVKVANQLVEAHARGTLFNALGPSTLFTFSRGTLTLASPTEGLPVPKGENLGERVVNLEKWLRSNHTDLLTADDIVIDYAQYLAPEFFSSGTADAKSDIYSFGVLTYRLATGRNPFASRALRDLVAEKLEYQVRPPGVLNFPSNPEFDFLISRALALAPASRFVDARSLLDALLAVPQKPAASKGAGTGAATDGGQPAEGGDDIGVLSDRPKQDQSILGRIRENILNPVLGEKEVNDDALLGAEYIASPQKPERPPPGSSPEQERAGYHPADEDEIRGAARPKAGYEKEGQGAKGRIFSAELKRKAQKLDDELTGALQEKLKKKQSEKEKERNIVLGGGIAQLSPVAMIVLLIALTAAAGGGMAWVLAQMKSKPPKAAAQASSQASAQAQASSASSRRAGRRPAAEPTIKLSGLPAVAVKIDKEPPAAPEVMRPKPGDVLADGALAFYGIAEELSAVEIFDNGVSLGRVRADRAWVWTFRPSPPLADGEHRISATATDEAGNPSKPSAEILIRIGRGGASPAPLSASSGGGGENASEKSAASAGGESASQSSSSSL